MVKDVGREEWRIAIDAPEGVEIIVGDESVENIALSHYADFRWWLGGPKDAWREELDFEPCWWLPRDWPRNPFKTPTPNSGDQDHD